MQVAILQRVSRNGTCSFCLGVVSLRPVPIGIRAAPDPTRVTHSIGPRPAREPRTNGVRTTSSRSSACVISPKPKHRFSALGGRAQCGNPLWPGGAAPDEATHCEAAPCETALVEASLLQTQSAAKAARLSKSHSYPIWATVGVSSNARAHLKRQSSGVFSNSARSGPATCTQPLALISLPDHTPHFTTVLSPFASWVFGSGVFLPWISWFP